MKLLTDEGIKKLITLKKQLEQQLPKTQENSQSTTALTMLIDTFNLLEELIQNNNTEFVKQNQAKIQQYCLNLDGDMGSCVPAVYNETSLQFALTMQKFINDFNIDTDFETKPQSLINMISLGKGKISLASAKNNLDTNIKLYQCAKKATAWEQQNPSISTILKKIQTTQDILVELLSQKLKALAEQDGNKTIPRRLQQSRYDKNSQEFLQQLEQCGLTTNNKEDNADVQKTITEYNHLCNVWHRKLKRLAPPYISIGGLEPDRSEPHTVTKKNGYYTTSLASQGQVNQGQVNDVLYIECLFSRKLQTFYATEAFLTEQINILNTSDKGNGLKLNGLYHQFYTDYLDSNDHTMLYQKLSQFITKTINEIDLYLTKKHLYFFQPIDPIKKGLLTFFKQTLEETLTLPDNDPGRVLIKLIGICVKSYLIHNYRVGEKKITYGKAGDIFTQSLPDLFELLAEISPTSDPFRFDEISRAFGKDKISYKTIQEHAEAESDQHKQSNAL